MSEIDRADLRRQGLIMSINAALDAAIGTPTTYANRQRAVGDLLQIIEFEVERRVSDDARRLRQAPNI